MNKSTPGYPVPATETGGWKRVLVTGGRLLLDHIGSTWLNRPGFGGHLAEAAALRSLHGRGIAPTLIDVVEHDGRTGLVLERFAGPDMLTLLPGRPWRGPGLARTLATLLLLRWANPLPDTPPLSRAMIAAGRSLLAREYERAYRRGAPPLRQVDSWLLVHAAARLSEGIQAEQATLTGILDRAQRTAKR